MMTARYLHGSFFKRERVLTPRPLAPTASIGGGTAMYEPDLETMSVDDIRKVQEERMLKQIRYAYDNVPFYKKKFEEAGITPDDIKSLDDVKKVPFTVKNDLRDHYPYGILAVPLEKIIEFHSSSGTTGIPTVVTYTERDLDTWSRMMARTFCAAGAKPGPFPLRP